MPTRQGWTIILGAIAALVLARVFGIIELFVIGAGMATAAVTAMVAVRVSRPDLMVSRWAHPAVLTVGDQGRVDLLIENRRTHRTGRAELSEAVGERTSARMTLLPLGGGQHVTAGYRVPAERRGTIFVGPTMIERRDLLGLAKDTRIVSDATPITVAPRVIELPMPSLGHGILGRHLLALAQRLGPGEFHSLRDYVVGDELRSIHWRASARSQNLKVKQYETQGVRRCVVVLDRDGDAYPAPVDDEDIDVFERAITAAASIVASADRVGLTTRFLTGPQIDLRGPDVATTTLRQLADITIGPPLDEIARDPGEGLGLVVVVTSSPDTDAWRRTASIADPTLTRVGVFTSRCPASPLHVDATTLDAFSAGWNKLAANGADRPPHTVAASA